MLEEFNEFLETDLTYCRGSNKDLYNMLYILKELVRGTEIPDEHIIDMNSKIGMYLDEMEYNDKDNLRRTFSDFSRRIQVYTIMLDNMGLDVIKLNFTKLKNYSEDDSIWK
jgi:hypothetical protein